MAPLKLEGRRVLYAAPTAYPCLKGHGPIEAQGNYYVVDRGVGDIHA